MTLLKDMSTHFYRYADADQQQVSGGQAEQEDVGDAAHAVVAGHWEDDQGIARNSKQKS